MTDNNRLHNGQFAPGNPGKQKGSTKNRLRDNIKTFIESNWEALPEWFEELKPKEKFDVILALLPYSVSRLQSVSITDPEGNEVRTPNIDYTKLSPGALSELLKLVEDESNRADNS